MYIVMLSVGRGGKSLVGSESSNGVGSNLLDGEGEPVGGVEGMSDFGEDALEGEGVVLGSGGEEIADGEASLFSLIIFCFLPCEGEVEGYIMAGEEGVA